MYGYIIQRCIIRTKFEVQQSYVQGETEKRKSACNWVGANCSSGPATCFYCKLIFSFFCFSLKNTLLDIKICICMHLCMYPNIFLIDFFMYILIYFSEVGACDGMRAQDTSSAAILSFCNPQCLTS